MGPRKSSLVSPPHSGGGDEPAPAESDVVLRSKCKDAYTAIGRKQIEKASRIVKTLFGHYGQDLGVLHHIQGMIHSELAKQSSDEGDELRHLKNAAESARVAAALSPDAVEFSLSLSLALFDLARKSGNLKWYEAVIEECTRGSAIENPRDPPKDNLRQDPGGSLNPAPELRIAYLKEDLDALKSKCEILVEVARSTTVEKSPEENNSSRFTREESPEKNNSSRDTREESPEENNSSIFTREESPEENNFSIFTRGETGSTRGKSKSSRGRILGSRGAEAEDFRLEKLRSLFLMVDARASTDVKTDVGVGETEAENSKLERIKSFWNTMSIEDKRAFMEVRIDKLERYVKSLNCGYGRKMFEDAVVFVPKYNKWTYWECGMCEKVFSDSKDCEEHFANVHLSALKSDQIDLLPEEEDDKYAEKLLNFDWKPVQTSTALQVMLRDYASGIVHAGALPNRWPKASDPDREDILRRIHNLLQTLLRRRCLSKNHRLWVQTYMLDQLLNSLRSSMLFELGMDKSLQCLCLLNVEALKKILWFLQELISVTRSDPLPEGQRYDLSIRERVRFCSRLILEGKSIEQDMDENDGGFLYDLPSDDAFLSWLLKRTPETTKMLESQMSLCDLRALVSMQIIGNYHDPEFNHLQSALNLKSRLESYGRALSSLKDIREKELGRIKRVLHFKSQTYAFVRTARTTLNVISVVVEKSSTLDVDISEIDDPGSLISSLLKELDTIRGENLIRDCISRVYDFVARAISGLDHSCSIRINREDAKILHRLDSIRKIRSILASLCAGDYRSIVVILMRSFMRQKLEDMARRDLMESSDRPELKPEENQELHVDENP